MQDKYLTIKEVCDRLSLGDDKVRSLINGGGLPCIRIGHRTVRISEAALNKYMHGMQKAGKA